MQIKGKAKNYKLFLLQRTLASVFYIQAEMHNDMHMHCIKDFRQKSSKNSFQKIKKLKMICLKVSI